MANKRTGMGVLDEGQRDLVATMLDGCYSLEHAAEQAGVAISTARKWWRRGHAVRCEYERQVEAKRAVLDNLVATVKDSRATPWSREQASNQLVKWMQLDAESAQERERRNRERRDFREMQKRERRGDAQGPPSWRRRAVPELAVVDQADSESDGAA